MGRRRRGESQVLTARDVGTINLGKDGKLEVDVMKKCSICGEEYFKYNPKNGTAARKSNTWTDAEEVAHKISHTDSTRARRVLAAIIALPNSDREVVLDFINKHYAG